MGNLIKNSISDNLKSLYPVGSIYITTSTATTCPLQSLGIGTWSKVGKGRCIQAATDSQNPNANIEAGLPQISGYFWDLASTLTNGLMANSSGVFYKGGRDDSAVRSVKAAYLTDYTNEPDGISFQASRSSSIYGKSTTVQPPAYLVHIWRRTA